VIAQAQKSVVAVPATSNQGTRVKMSARAEAGSKKRHSYRPLPKQFQRDGFTYWQVARENDAAIYAQTWNDCPNASVSYDVIRIRRREGFEIKGRYVEAAEVYPNSDNWGVDGFTTADKDTAFRKLRELVGEKEPKPVLENRLHDM